jgi:hypothetical protein
VSYMRFDFSGVLANAGFSVSICVEYSQIADTVPSWLFHSHDSEHAILHSVCENNLYSYWIFSFAARFVIILPQLQLT